MREERKKQETNLLNKIRGYEEYKYDNDEEEELEDLKEEEELEAKPSFIKRFLIIVLLTIILVVIYSIYIEPKYLFKVREYGVNAVNFNEKNNGLKIVQFADIHYGTSIGKNELKKVIKEINKLKPDIVIYSGDLFDKNIKLNNDSKKYITKMLNNIEAKYYKYAIYGDDDYSFKEEYIEIMNSSNFILLNNQNNILYINDIPIVIAGINDSENNDYSFINMVDEQDVSNSFKIVIDHQPDNIDNYLDKRPDMILTAHSLGGIVRIPFIGGIIKNKGATKYNDDFVDINNTLIYNSYGLGTSNVNIRFNNIPSINLYRIYKA